MSDVDRSSALHVRARDIPMPAHLSPAAQAMLAQPREILEYPPADDIAKWRDYIARLDGVVLAMLQPLASQISADSEATEVNGVRVFTSTPHGAAVRDGAIFLDVHGGALVAGGGESCRILGGLWADKVGARTCSVDYRMPPDHPYPAGLDDCLTVYRAMLQDHDPAKIIISGTSAGGNLAAAMILRARDEGLPLPAATVLISPEVDLTESGDSFHANMGVDTTLTRSLMPANLLYAGGCDLTDPYVSPLFGDFSKGFPPTLLTAGTRDLFLSNAVRMHRALRAADIPAELHIAEAAPHSGLGNSPEGQAINAEVRRFVDTYWKRAS